MSTRAEDIARLKAHCSLLKGLPDRVVEQLYLAWGMGWIPPESRGGMSQRTYAEMFTSHCIRLWSGEES